MKSHRELSLRSSVTSPYLRRYPKCPGCKREEIHMYCPAYGTAFYMTEEPYTLEIERLLCKHTHDMGIMDATLGNPRSLKFRGVLNRAYEEGYNSV